MMMNVLIGFGVVVAAIILVFAALEFIAWKTRPW